MEGQEQHLHILHTVSEKYPPTLSSSQGSTTAPQTDSETGEERSPPAWARMLISQIPGDFTDPDCDWLSPSSAALGLGVCTVIGSCSSRGFGSLALTHSPKLTFPHVSVVLQEIMHWFSHSLVRVLLCLVSSQINRQEACFALCTSFQPPWIILLQLLPNCQQKYSQR